MTTKDTFLRPIFSFPTTPMFCLFVSVLHPNISCATYISNRALSPLLLYSFEKRDFYDTRWGNTPGRNFNSNDITRSMSQRNSLSTWDTRYLAQTAWSLVHARVSRVLFSRLLNSAADHQLPKGEYHLCLTRTMANVQNVVFKIDHRSEILSNLFSKCTTLRSTSSLLNVLLWFRL